ncbi:hypothetical protein [Thermopirellula anaerolimosa]
MSSALSVLLGIACLGIEVGWRPLPDGGMEYVIRVSPEELADLKLGDIIAASDVPPGLPSIRSYRIEVGRGPVERRTPPFSPAITDTPAVPGSPAALDDQRSTPSDGTLPSPTIPLVFTEPAVPRPMEASPPASTQGAAQGTPSPETTASPPNSQKAEAAQPQEGRETQPPADSSPPPPEKSTANSNSLMNTLALSGMTASFAAVLYIGWVAWEYRRKYLELLRASHQLPQPASDDVVAAALQGPSASRD